MGEVVKLSGEGEEFYLFFRQRCLALQSRFSELANLKSSPRVFLHGNPHVDNFAKTLHGEAMIDFDRSRVGPYCWDIVRLLCSVSLKREEAGKRFLSKRVVRDFLDGYLAGFEKPEVRFRAPELLKQLRPRDWEKSTAAYLQHNKRWAQKMRARPLFPSHPTVQALVAGYFQSRHESDWDAQWRINEAGQASGSLGKGRIIVALASLKDKNDQILLDLKEVYDDMDSVHFYNPYVHHGLRMIEASFLHAPRFEQRLGFMSFRGKQYWGRQIPTFKAKLKGTLNENQQADFVAAVGGQLGRAHRMSLRAAEPKQLEKDLKENFGTWLGVAERLNEELRRAWEYSTATALLAPPRVEVKEPVDVQPQTLVAHSAMQYVRG